MPPGPSVPSFACPVRRLHTPGYPMQKNVLFPDDCYPAVFHSSTRDNGRTRPCDWSFRFVDRSDCTRAITQTTNNRKNIHRLHIGSRSTRQEQESLVNSHLTFLICHLTQLGP